MTMYAQNNVNQWNKELQEQFLSKHWQLVTNKVDHLVFKKENNNYDYFEIKIEYSTSVPYSGSVTTRSAQSHSLDTQDSTRINVSIPLRNSQYQYGTHFNNYFDATEFIEQHLQNYED